MPLMILLKANRATKRFLPLPGLLFEKYTNVKAVYGRYLQRII
jgi:hypothetical protein